MGFVCLRKCWFLVYGFLDFRRYTLCFTHVVMCWRFADSEGKCDLFDGDWIPDKSEPFYTNNSCEFIEKHQNCMKNGRPDRGYLYWRWKPRGCDLARLDPWRFLDLMRNKSWALIGDSISRNHVQSLLCMLSVVKAFIMLLQYILSSLAYTNLVFHAFAMLISASKLLIKVV